MNPQQRHELTKAIRQTPIRIPEPVVSAADQPDYTFRVLEVLDVKDGDTYLLRVDNYFGSGQTIYTRLADYDCPESQKRGSRPVSDFEKAQALRAKNFASLWLDSALLNQALWVKTDKDPEGGFNRWRGKIWEGTRATGDLLGDSLVKAALATTYPIRWYERYDPETYDSAGRPNI